MYDRDDRDIEPADYQPTAPQPAPEVCERCGYYKCICHELPAAAPEQKPPQRCSHCGGLTGHYPGCPNDRYVSADEQICPRGCGHERKFYNEEAQACEHTTGLTRIDVFCGCDCYRIPLTDAEITAFANPAAAPAVAEYGEPVGDGRYCTHHDDDPAHTKECYDAPAAQPVAPQPAGDEPPELSPSWEAVEIAEGLANPAIGKVKIPDWRAMVTDIALAIDAARLRTADHPAGEQARLAAEKAAKELERQQLLTHCGSSMKTGDVEYVTEIIVESIGGTATTEKDSLSRFAAHFMMKVEPFYFAKHGKNCPDEGKLWEYLAFVQHQLSAAAPVPAQELVPSTFVLGVARRDPYFRKWMIEQLTAMG